MINKVILLGRVGKDPELKRFGENCVCNFSMATSESYKDKDGEWKELTEWHNVSVWGAYGERLSNNIKKGSLLYLEGKINTREYEVDGSKRYATSINSSLVKILNKDKSTEGSFSAPTESQAPPISSNNDGFPFYLWQEK